MWHYARGLALVATGELARARAEHDSVAAIAAATPADQVVGMNSAAALLKLASEALSGELAAKRGQTDDAVRHLEEAVRLQDNLRYDEPPPWYYPVRQSLGAVLLVANRPAQAEAAYRADLERNPENGWSLYGLAKSLRAQHRGAEADAVEQRFKKAWADADVTLTASRF
jgi:tetratricopeptide (TPR) repeat protein